MEKDSSNAIEVFNLTVSYTHKPALWDVDLAIPKGVLCGIIGPNGSGKSTLLKTIMGLIKPDTGSVRVFGKPIDEVRKRVSYVPQRESVDWHFPVSVMDVALMGVYSRKSIFSKITAADREIASQALAKVNLLEYKDRHISQLSGGQQQRVFLARALAQQADLYIMDEPFAGVDAITEDAILHLLKEMKEDGKTVVIVHHDLQTAYDFFDFIVMLNSRLVVAAPKEQAFNKRYLQEAYGSKLAILSKISELFGADDLKRTTTEINRDVADV
ncbi:MAG: metal ABC transporter ATP-binding protein [Thermaurantimonas sp.]|uniref:metal ABC transporter ATP-binding protein n=1 Tax=Thermaurantimonas sp. TaxID=2681568 RepID=UPI00391997F2